MTGEKAREIIGASRGGWQNADPESALWFWTLCEEPERELLIKAAIAKGVDCGGCMVGRVGNPLDVAGDKQGLLVPGDDWEGRACPPEGDVDGVGS